MTLNSIRLSILAILSLSTFDAVYADPPEQTGITIPQYICNNSPSDAHPNPSCDQKYKKSNGNGAHAKVLFLGKNVLSVSSVALSSTTSMIVDNEKVGPISGSGNAIDDTEISKSDNELHSEFKLYLSSLNYGAVAEVETKITLKIENGNAPSNGASSLTGCVKRFPLNQSFTTVTNETVLNNGELIDCSPSSWNSAQLVVLLDENGAITGFNTFTGIQKWFASLPSEQKSNGPVVTYAEDYQGGETPSENYDLSLSIATGSFGGLGSSSDYLNDAQVKLGYDYECFKHTDPTLGLNGASSFMSSLGNHSFDIFQPNLQIGDISDSRELNVALGSTEYVTCFIYTQVSENTATPRNKAVNKSFNFSSTIKLKLDQDYIIVETPATYPTEGPLEDTSSDL